MTNPRRMLLSSAILLLLPAAFSLPYLTAQQGTGELRAAHGQTITLLPDGSHLLIGGEEDPGRAVIRERRDGASRALGRLLVPRSWHSATVLPDGSVLIAGGIGAEGRIADQVERFDPATASFTPLPDSPVTPRAHHTATLLTDGRVLFVGGEASPGGVPAELWDPATNTVVPVPGPPRYTRRNGVARLMADGRVEFSRGDDERGAPVEASEFFDPELSSFVYAGPEPPSVDDTPRVAAITPQDGAEGVPPNVRIAMRFSTRVDAASSTAIGLSGPNGAVAVTVVVAENGMLAFVTPHTALEDGEYVVSVNGVKTPEGGDVARLSTTFTVSSRENSDDASTAPMDWRGDAERAFNSPWRKLPPLKAKAGVTALAGQVLLLDGEPLRHVTLEIGSRRARTDRTGRFLLELGNAPSGWQEMVIDGTTANRPGVEYGVFEVAVQLVGEETAALPYTIWMPRLDPANRVRIDSPTTSEVVITTPHIPGLELHLPKHTVITDRHGKVVREVGITPIPVDRPPFPLPSGVEVPVYFTIQPGGAYLTTHSYGPGRKGPWLVYPNYKQDAPGTRANFWHYDPEDKGWYVYGVGAVSADGSRVIPNYNVALYELTGAMMNTGRTPPGTGPVRHASDGDPVDLATGLFVMEKTDLALADVVPLALTRTYRPNDNATRPFGIGTTHPYAMFLWSADPYQEADLVLPTGQRIHYVRTSPGNVYSTAVFEHTATPGAFHTSVITWNGDGWDLRLKDGTVYVFGDNKPLQAIRDRFGNSTQLTYDVPNGNIITITSPTGRFIKLTYDGTNRITQAKDSIGRTVGYEYDAAGRLWKVTDARGGVTEYSYDIAHRMLTIKDPRNIIYLDNEYDTSGRVILQTQADGGEFEFAYTLDGSGKITQTDVTNPRGFVRRVTFNADGYPTSDVAALGEAVEQATTYTRLTGSNLVETETDALGRVRRYTYDADGNVTTVTQLYGTADAVTTTYTYDPTYHLLTSTTDPLTHTSTIAYDSHGRIQSTTNPLTHQTIFGTNTAGQVVSVTDPLAKTTTFGYALGDLVSVHTPLGHAQARFVDAAGRLVLVTDALGMPTRFEYDAHDHVTKITDPKGGETSFTYDPNGNLLTLTDARGKATTWTYDEMDRIESWTDPLSRTESVAYDLNGNRATWTDRKGQVTTYQYDALDRQTFVGFGTTGTPATYASTIATTYDAGDRATEIVDSVGGTIEREYDLLDRLTEEATPQGIVSYTYDDAGRRTSMTVAGQPQVTYTYDNADRLTSVAKGTAAVSIGYDNARRASLTLPNGIVVEYGYDDDSRLTSLTYKHGMTTLEEAM